MVKLTREELLSEISARRREIHETRRSLNALRIQEAKFGLYVPPHVTNAIEDTEKQIVYLENEIYRLQNYLNRVRTTRVIFKTILWIIIAVSSLATIIVLINFISNARQVFDFPSSEASSEAPSSLNDTTASRTVDDEIINAVQSFNRDLALATRDLDPSILRRSATGRGLSFQTSYITEELINKGLYEIQRNTYFKVVKLEYFVDHVEVETQETWHNNLFDFTTEECLYTQKFSNQQTYTLVEEGSSWKVSWVSFDSPIEGFQPGCY